MSRYGAAPDPVSWLDRLQAVVRGLLHTPEYRQPPRYTVRPEYPAPPPSAWPRKEYPWSRFTVSAPGNGALLPLTILDSGTENRGSWVAYAVTAYDIATGAPVAAFGYDEAMYDHGAVTPSWRYIQGPQSVIPPMPLPYAIIEVRIPASDPANTYVLAGFAIYDR